MTPRVVFFGSAGNVFSERFYTALRRARCQVVAVVDVPAARRASTNPTAAADQARFTTDAARRGVPVFQPANPNATALVATLRRLSPDLFFAVGYMFRLDAKLLAVPRIVAANAHASLLPAYRGRSPVFWALRHGERSSGLTIHAMDTGLDTGDLLYQVRVRTRRDDTVAALYDRIIARGVALVPRLLADATRGRLPRRPQPAGRGSYFSAATEDNYRLDWAQPAEQLRRWIASTPGKCFAEIDGRRLYFQKAVVVAQRRRVVPGTILREGTTSWTIATSQGALRVTTAATPSCSARVSRPRRAADRRSPIVRHIGRPAHSRA